MKLKKFCWALLTFCHVLGAAGPHFITNEQEAKKLYVPQKGQKDAPVRILFCSIASYNEAGAHANTGYRQSFPYYLELLAKDPALLEKLCILLVDPGWNSLEAYEKSDLKRYLNTLDKKFREHIEDKTYLFSGDFSAPRLEKFENPENPNTDIIEKETKPTWLWPLVQRIAFRGDIVIFNDSDPTRYVERGLAALYNATRHIAKHKPNIQLIGRPIWFSSHAVDDLIHAILKRREIAFEKAVAQGATKLPDDFNKGLDAELHNSDYYARIWMQGIPSYYKIAKAVNDGAQVYNVATGKMEKLSKDFICNGKLPYLLVSISPNATTPISITGYRETYFGYPLLTFTIDKTAKRNWKLEPSLNWKTDKFDYRDTATAIKKRAERDQELKATVVGSSK